MPPPKLYDEGWRQGALIRAPLEVHYLDSDAGVAAPRSTTYDLWLLATQDCDLAQTSATNTTRQFELRPVLPRDEGDKLDGLRSRTVLVRDNLVLRADSPKLTLTARALSTLKDKREDDLSPVRRAEIKAWLGLRYDRPAVPRRFEELARLLKRHFIENIPPSIRGALRDVWVYFESETEVRVFAILSEAADSLRDAVLDWIDDTSGQILDSDGIVIIERQAESSRGTSLWILQNYYGLDATDLSV